ncbi:MAG: Cna B-type domain-containing protein [Oscillospiraceae bacterium]
MPVKSSKLFGALLCVFGLIVTMISGLIPAAAEESAEGSITLICTKEEAAVASLEWNLYKVGERTPYGEFVLTGDFADYPVSLEDISASAISQAAVTLENYAAVDGIEPLVTAVTDENGLADFRPLGLGLYLISADPITIGNTVYTPSPAILEVRDIELEITAFPKFTAQDIPQPVETEFSVEKAWENTENDPKGKPESVTVEIYCDDALYESVTLSEDNGWSYSWEGLADSEWRVAEVDAPENYLVTYGFDDPAEKTDFVITNTYDVPDDSSSQPESGGTGSGFDTSSAIDNSSQPSSKPPQTGQLWWPVPVLALIGLVMIVLGVRVCSKKENDR